MYRDYYLNNTLVDLNKIITDNTENTEEEAIISEEVPVKEFHYEEKNYDLNAFLKEKKANRVDDNLPRSLDNKIKDSESVINKIISEIEEKEENEDLFASLLPDDENTIVTEHAKEEKLDTFISDSVIDNYVMNKDIDETNSFMDIDDTSEEIKIANNNKDNPKPKIKKGAIILFAISLLMLIGVIVYISIK